MNTLTVRPTPLITLSRCPVRWCTHYGNDVPTDHTHHSDQPPIALALEGGAVLPPAFVHGDGPDGYDPRDYGLPTVSADLIKPTDDALHIGLYVCFVGDGSEAPRLTVDEAEQLRDQLDELLAIARKASAR